MCPVYSLASGYYEKAAQAGVLVDVTYEIFMVA